MDYSRDADVSLKGIDFDYKSVCSRKAKANAYKGAELGNGREISAGS